MSVRQQEFTASDYRRYCPLPKLGPCPAGLLQREKQLLSFFQTSDPMRAAYCSAALYMLLADLLRVSRASRERSKAEVITSRLVTFLEENPNRAITAQEIEKWMRMSYKYLCGVFKENTGMSIHQYHTQLRIHEAARLLRETTLNISEIGYQVGYQDPLYFSHVFKRVKGCSPSEYARQPVQEP